MVTHKKQQYRRIRSRHKSEISYKSSILLLCLLGVLSGMVAYALGHEVNIKVFKGPTQIGKDINVLPEVKKPEGSITGQECLGATSRPFAVMLAGDREARPLSGIQAADMVIEMPVIVGSITRYMALFQCGQPSEIGSVRSARGPFIGLANGYGAIFGHWGGEHDALARLNAGIVNNINALTNPFSAYWRKPSIPRPHNGFTSYERLTQSAQKLGYDLTWNRQPFFSFVNIKSCITCPVRSITVEYPGIFKVMYRYNPASGLYERFKGGTPETDALTGQQVSTTNVVMLWARIYPTYSQYDDIELDGAQGRLQAFIGGRAFDGVWKKENNEAPLLFYDTQGKPLPLSLGTTWVQVLGLDQGVSIDPPLQTPVSVSPA